MRCKIPFEFIISICIVNFVFAKPPTVPNVKKKEKISCRYIMSKGSNFNFQWAYVSPGKIQESNSIATTQVSKNHADEIKTKLEMEETGYTLNLNSSTTTAGQLSPNFFKLAFHLEPTTTTGNSNLVLSVGRSTDKNIKYNVASVSDKIPSGIKVFTGKQRGILVEITNSYDQTTEYVMVEE
jgi:hypothetical protein